MLAINGGEPAIKSLRPFNTIGEKEIAAAVSAMRSGPLSGYLGGQRHGGFHVEALERWFCNKFCVKHAVAVNSATSGLLIAFMTARSDTYITSPYTMSGTIAPAAVLGGKILFTDIEDWTFNMDRVDHPVEGGVIVVPNIFGHPAELRQLRKFADANKMIMIEDNAQSIFAMENGKYAGTIGHMGVFSANVHKHLHAGEGGIVVTDDDNMADHLRMYRNHGELAGYPAGLNLRMTEVTAAILLAQLKKQKKIMDRRICIGGILTGFALPFFPYLVPPVFRKGCKHVYYMWAMKTDDRRWVVDALNAEGFPIMPGYVNPLYNLPAFKADPVPVTERMQNEALCTFEVCGYELGTKELRCVKAAFEKVGEEYLKRRAAG